MIELMAMLIVLAKALLKIVRDHDLQTEIPEKLIPYLHWLDESKLSWESFDQESWSP